MNDFHANLQAWQAFYATVGAAAATLSGLLFVSLSLNRDRLKGNRAHNVIAMARHTFSDFLYVLMIALVFLIPHQVPFSLTMALVVLGLSRGIGLVTEARRYRKARSSRFSMQMTLREIAFPFIASTGLIVVAIFVLLNQTDFMYWLVIVVAALLVTACWNAWLLLIEE